MNAERVELAAQRVILAVVGLAAGAASFTHMHDWTMTHSPDGTPDWFGWANACISELVPVAALLKMRQHRRDGRSITYPLCLLLAAAVLSLAAQLAVAKPSPSGWLLSAVPALAFIALVKLVLAGSDTRLSTRATVVEVEGTEDAQLLDELYDEPDPWEYAEPVRPEGQAGIEKGGSEESREESTHLIPRHRPASRVTAAAVLTAAAELPAGAKPAEIAARAKVSESTVRRYLPQSEPGLRRSKKTVPTQPSEELAAAI